MPINQQNHFAQQLSHWLYASNWHFTTLLAVTIESVNHLPDDADKLINEVLLAFPAKPSTLEILNFMLSNERFKDWFRYQYTWPKIKSLNLNISDRLPATDANLPASATIHTLSDWLNISESELDWLADLRRHETRIPSKLNHYHYSFVAKRRGGMRLIESPKSLLKEAQRLINSQILSDMPFHCVPIHNAAHGFRTGRNCLTHARNHTGKRTLFLFDVANFFHSVQWKSVYGVFKNLCYSPDVTRYLTGLCTHQFKGDEFISGKLDTEQRVLINQRHLPQGAPTSPALSNAVMYGLDKRLAGLADSLELNYSRYADDLAFSGNRERNWDFLAPLVGSICLEQGFELNYRKSRIIRSHQRQKLTGIVVNQTPNIDRRYYDRLKAILTNCVRFGLESQNRDRHENFYAHLCGSVGYVSTLNKNRGEKLRKIFNRIFEVQ